MYLKVNCPEDASLKGLAKNLVFAVFQLIGPDKELANLLLNTSVTRKDLIIALRHLISTYFIGVLIIDEIRNLFAKQNRTPGRNNKGRDSEIVAFLMNLRDEVKIPIILIGTPEAAEHLDTSLSINRRLARDGDFSMTPAIAEDDVDWELLCETVWPNQVLKKRVKLTKPVRRKFFERSAAVPGLFLALFQSSQRWAIRTSLEEINTDVIDLAYENDFKRLHEIVDALIKGDQTAKLRWEDVWVPGNRK